MNMPEGIRFAVEARIERIRSTITSRDTSRKTWTRFQMNDTSVNCKNWQELNNDRDNLYIWTG